jgi:probable F420-dependent oxidoreductase
MKFSVSIPLGAIEPEGEYQTAQAAAEMGQALERAGVHACYVTDHPAPSEAWLFNPSGLGHDAADPFTCLAFVAAATTRLRLHTNIVVLPYRNPFLTAKAAATLSVFSGGRVILGCGGGYQRAEFEALGVDFTKRGKLFDEALETIKLAWSGETVVKQGMNFNAADARPRPAPSPQPWIWIGGGSEKAIERAAQFGDGWSPFFVAPSMSQLNRDSGVTSVEDLADKVIHLRELLDKQERGQIPFDVCIGHASPREMTKSEAERFLNTLGPLAEAGATWAPVGLPHPSRAGYIEHVQWFGEEVIART